MQEGSKWPYPAKTGETTHLEADVLVLGGGIAGCMVAIAKAMQNYCGEQKRDELLQSGVELLERYQREVVPRTCAANPHELMRLLEVFGILTVAQIILQACLARRQTCGKLEFYRTDGDGQAPAPFLCIRQDGEKVVRREVPLDYAGDLKANYEKFNQDYIREKGEEARL